MSFHLGKEEMDANESIVTVSSMSDDPLVANKVDSTSVRPQRTPAAIVSTQPLVFIAMDLKNVVERAAVGKRKNLEART